MVLESGFRIDVRRVVAIDQQTSIKNQGAFFAEIHEEVFDKLTHIDQQQEFELEASVKVVNSDGGAAGGTIENTPDTLIGFDSDGNLKSEPLGSGGGGGGSIVVEDRLQDEIDNIIGTDGSGDTEDSSQLDSEGKSLEKLKIQADGIRSDLGTADGKSDSGGTVYERIESVKGDLDSIEETVNGYVDRSGPLPRAVPGNTAKITTLQEQVDGPNGLNRRFTNLDIDVETEVSDRVASTDRYQQGKDIHRLGAIRPSNTGGH